MADGPFVLTMSQVSNVAWLLTIAILVDFISGAFVVVNGFAQWDLMAAAVTIFLSACLVYIELLNRWKCAAKGPFLNILILCVLFGGASAFFWFFHMIYKIGHHRGDYIDLLWCLPTRVIAFGMSIQLVLRAHRLYTTLILEFLVDEYTDDDVTPLAITTLRPRNDDNNNSSKDECPA